MARVERLRLNVSDIRGWLSPPSARSATAPGPLSIVGSPSVPGAGFRCFTYPMTGAQVGVEQALERASGHDDASTKPKARQFAALDEVVRESAGDAEHFSGFFDGEGQSRIIHRGLLSRQ